MQFEHNLKWSSLNGLFLYLANWSAAGQTLHLDLAPRYLLLLIWFQSGPYRLLAGLAALARSICIQNRSRSSLAIAIHLRLDPKDKRAQTV